MIPLTSLFGEANRASLEEFRTRHGADWWLVVESFTPAPDWLVSTHAPGASGRNTGELAAAPLVKREGGNAFSGMVTIGRAENNDVVLAAGDVSKFHAYVAVGEGPPQLHDAGSAHGTFLEEQQLQHRDGTPVPNLAEIRFGSVVARLASTTSLHTYLRTGSYGA